MALPVLRGASSKPLLVAAGAKKTLAAVGLGGGWAEKNSRRSALMVLRLTPRRP
jgi:hypothetical protein